MKFKGLAVILGVALGFALAGTALAVEKGFMWDGSHWKELSQELKVAYIKGIGNMADFEVATGSSGRAACISKAFVDELQHKSLGQVVAEVEKYYQENPDKMKTPVVEVILRSCTKLCPPETSAEKKK